MAVFDATQNQVLFSPVSNYYQGKAIRAGLRQEELKNESLELQNEAIKAQNTPEALARAKEMLELDRQKAILDVQKGIEDLGYERMKRRATAMRPVVEEAQNLFREGKVDEASALISKGIPAALMDVDPEGAEQIMEMAGPDKVWQPEEMMRLNNRIEAFGQIEKDGGGWINFRNPETGEEKSVRTESGEAQSLADEGWVRVGIVGRNLETDDPATAFGGGVGDKVSDRKVREVIGSSENLLSSVDRITKQVDQMDQSALGLPGAAASLVDNAVSAVSGFSEMLGGIAEIDGREVSESALLDVKLYQDVFVGAATDNAALQANAVGLAYALARAANPDGRISDADVRHQLKRVKLDQSSKTQIQASLKEVKREVLTNVANHLRVYGYNKTKEGKSAYDKYMKELDKMSSTDAKALAVGDVVDGWTYKGGDPADKSNWEKQ